MHDVRNGGAANGHASGEHNRDDGVAVASDHRSRNQSSGHAIPERYKLVLFNNEVLRLDSVSGSVWILDFERDPQSRRLVRPRWVVVGVEPASSADLTDLSGLTGGVLQET